MNAKTRKEIMKKFIEKVIKKAEELVEEENQSQYGSDNIRLNYFTGMIKGLSLAIEPYGYGLSFSKETFIPFTSKEEGLKGWQRELKIHYPGDYNDQSRG